MLDAREATQSSERLDVEHVPPPTNEVWGSDDFVAAPPVGGPPSNLDESRLLPK